MNRPPEPLTSREHRQLVELVRRRDPSLLPLATKAVNQRWLTDDEVAALGDLALDEFLAHLDPNGGPDRQGVVFDDLAGLMEKQRRSFWD